MLHEFAVKQLKDLIHLLDRIDDNEYSQPMESVFYSTVGKHTRHIIEFYHIFYKGYKKGSLSYDKRKRQPEIETNKLLAINKLDKLLTKLKRIPNDKNLELKVNIHGKTYKMPTTVSREFLYLMEHTTHHIALIRVGISNINPSFQYEENIGIAYSTPNIKV